MAQQTKVKRQMPTVLSISTRAFYLYSIKKRIILRVCQRTTAMLSFSYQHLCLKPKIAGYCISLVSLYSLDFINLYYKLGVCKVA